MFLFDVFNSAIYNEAVANTRASYDYEPSSLPEREALFTQRVIWRPLQHCELSALEQLAKAAIKRHQMLIHL